MITCIIPVHNRSHLLRRAIHSVVIQEIMGTELIVVDDASTEDLSTPVQEFQGTPGLELKYFRLPRGGANAARAFGQSQATRPFVQYLDSDDVLLAGKWVAQVDHFEERRDLDVSVAGTFRVGATDERFCFDPGYPNRSIDAMSFLWDQTMFKTGASLWKRSLVTEVVKWPIALRSSQDWETHLRALLCGARFEYCLNSGYLQLGTSSDRISDLPVSAKAVNKVWALYYALSAARDEGRTIVLPIRGTVLLMATRRVLTYLRRNPLRDIGEVADPYRRLLQACFS